MSDTTLTPKQEHIIIRVARIMLALALLGACVWFIWSNSMQSPEASARRSELVAAYVGRVLSAIFGAQSGIVAFAQTHIRKIAHALEFALLGFTSVMMLAILNKVTISNLAHAAFLVLLVAVADETIQIYSNRGSSVADVVLDFAGGIGGILIACVVFIAIRGLFRMIRGNRS